ncbi:hypothetical protein FRC09_017263 [Ceratobasidium sp. 395]|nr:hypothetical protein FRC09_017263 [Ceratobasidium sp. 395]
MSKGPHSIGVEYEGRKVAIRGSANYDVTVSSVKRAFKALRSVEADRISLTAFLEDLGGIYEISEELWPTILPNLKHVIIVLDSSPRSAERDPSLSASDFFFDIPSDDSCLRPLEHERPLTVADLYKEAELVEMSKRSSPQPGASQGKPISTSTIPEQPDRPEAWNDVPMQNISRQLVVISISPHELGHNFIVLTTPKTTIPDLKEFIISRKPENIGPDAQFEFSMYPPDPSGKNIAQSHDLSKDLLAAEYKDKKVVIHRSSDYNATITSLMKAFRDLRSVSPEQIAILTFLKGFKDRHEVPPDVWPMVLPRIKYITIVLYGHVPEPRSIAAPNCAGRNESPEMSHEAEVGNPTKSNP